MGKNIYLAILKGLIAFSLFWVASSFAEEKPNSDPASSPHSGVGVISVVILNDLHDYIFIYGLKSASDDVKKVVRRNITFKLSDSLFYLKRNTDDGVHARVCSFHARHQGDYKTISNNMSCGEGDKLCQNILHINQWCLDGK